MIYWITWGAIIFFTAFIAIFFELSMDKVPLAYVLLADILGAIPIFNWIVSLGLIILVVGGIANEDLTPKDLNTNKDK